MKAPPAGELAVTPADVRAAAARIAGLARRTPLLRCDALSERAGREIYLKCESMQRTGSFKFRGACNAVCLLPETDAPRGVVTHSSGNHALALAEAARVRGIPCHVVMPGNASALKRRAVERAGASVTTCGNTAAAREAAAEDVRTKTGATMVPPYDHPWVIAGQGTIALEILEELPGAECIVVPVGGGGLIGGIAVAARADRPAMRIVGAEPALADDAAASKRLGSRQPQRDPVTVADGLRAPLGRLTFPIVDRLVDDIAVVSEEEIVSAMRLAFEELRLVIEPSAAVGIAAVVEGRLGGRTQGPVACVVCGGNADLSALPWRQGGTPGRDISPSW